MMLLLLLLLLLLLVVAQIARVAIRREWVIGEDIGTFFVGAWGKMLRRRCAQVCHPLPGIILTKVPLRLGSRHGQTSSGRRRCRRCRRALSMTALVIEQMWPHREESDGQDGKGDNHLPGMGGT